MTNYKGNAEQLINKTIQCGSAKERFRRMLLAQGVTEDFVKQIMQAEPVLPTSKYTTPLLAHSSGWVSDVDAWRVGHVCLELGAGRRKADDTIDPTAGVVLSKHVGDTVIEGDVWLTIHHSSTLCPQILEYIQQAITIVSNFIEKPDVIIEVIQ